MENFQLQTYTAQVPVGPIKESIRDMIRLQRDYQISDELFWEIFSAHVLLDEHVDVSALLSELNIPVVHT